MEKKETKKKEKVTSEKVVKEKVVSNKELFSLEQRRVVKIIAAIVTFFATMLGIVVFVFGIIATLSVANGTKEEILSNNTVLTFISNTNHYTNAEAQSAIENMGSKPLFIIFEIVVPALALTCAMILVIYLAMRVVEFIRGVSKESELYTKSKYEDIKEMVEILSTALFVTFLIFDKPSIVFFLLIELLLLIIVVLFKKVVDLQKK